MKVAIFVETEDGALGFSTENDERFEWQQKHYHVINLPEKEVKELKQAFAAYAEAQKKISSLLKQIHDGELKTVSMIETEEWLKNLFSENY